MAKAKSQKKKLVQINSNQQALLRALPGVDHLMALTAEEVFFKDIPPVVVVNSIRSVIETKRRAILSDDPSITKDSLSDSRLIDGVKYAVEKAMTPNLKNTINATGVVVHTNLGRSLLAPEVVENLETIASRYSNLEYNLDIGKRGSRYSSVEDLICEISGAEAAMVVNNNAGAVLLCLETLARNKEVVVSRGELVEIGGSFRVPDVMAKSGGILKEVGTTNRTHLKDYENAITSNTGLLLKVHTSNYSVVGFTAEVSLPELVDLGAAHQLPVMEDLGSGTFIDFSKYGLLKEPTVQESVTAGADVITFSGDKLLGGPQSGIIVGKKEVVDRIKKNPITRALRIDKLTLAALESTLRLYRDEEKAVRTIPTLRMIMRPLEEIQKQAQQLAAALKKKCGDAHLHVQFLERSSKTGGGALPLMELPSLCVGIQIKGISPNTIEKTMRSNNPPIIGRIEDDLFVMDPRTIQKDEFPIIETALKNLTQKA
jgi:L-seryl-tRNA(Ser) seleniumtransferase